MMVPICFVGKLHNPFIAMEHQLQQQQQHLQQLTTAPNTPQNFQLQPCSPPAATAPPFSSSLSTSVTTNSNHGEQRLQMVETAALTKHEDTENPQKRTWRAAGTSGSGCDEHSDRPEKILCKDRNPQNSRSELDEPDTRSLSQTDCIDLPCGEQHHARPTGTPTEDHNIDKDLEETPNLDSAPGTPSSGFIDIESDTPPSSPLNLTTPTTNGASSTNTGAVDSGNSAEEEILDGPNHRSTSVTSHHDSALGLDVDSADKSHVTIKNGTGDSARLDHSTSQNKTLSNPVVKTESASKEVYLKRNEDLHHNGGSKLHQSPPQTAPAHPSEQESARTNFSIDAILSPRFGCASPKQNPKTGARQSSPGPPDVTASRPTGQGDSPRPVPSSKHSPSAFSAVDLRTGTRSSSISSPSPSSRSSALSSPCSGSPSPPLPSFPMPLPIPAFYTKDFLAGSDLLPESPAHPDKYHTLNPRSLSDPRKLFLSELYQLHYPQADPAAGEKLRHRFLEGSRDAQLNSNADKHDVSRLQKFFPNPSRDLDNFISRHLPFLTHPSLSHPTAALPFIYASQHQHQHPDHRQQQEQQHKHHPTLLSPTTAQMVAPPLLDTPHPQLDPLRLLQPAGHPSFFPGSPPVALPTKSERHPKRAESTNPTRNVAKLHADHITGNSTPSTTKQPCLQDTLSIENKTTEPGNSDVKDFLSISNNPLHNIIRQFDPENLFKTKEGLLSPRLSSCQSGDKPRRRSAVSSCDRLKTPSQAPQGDKQSSNHEQRKTSQNLKANPEHSKTVDQHDSKPSFVRSVLSPSTHGNSDRDSGPKRGNPQAKGNNSSKSDTDVSATEDDGKGAKGENPLWPAWVFCTRYSDRPSSGRFARPHMHVVLYGMVKF